MRAEQKSLLEQLPFFTPVGWMVVLCAVFWVGFIVAMVGTL